MTDIRDYTKEREQRERGRSGYRKVIARHKRAGIYRFLLLVLAFGALAALVVVQYKNHVYTAYDIIGSVERSSVSSTTDLRLGEAFLTYSKDGAHCTNLAGEVRWNQTYEMQDMEMAICGDTVAIGEYNGRKVYVANAEELLGQITTNMPIRALTVAETGRVTAVVEDTDVVWINTYDPDGKLKYKGQAHMDDSGYPTAVSLSPNGELLGVAYMYLDAGVLKTNVAFYNFGAVGDNYSDHLATVQIYADLVVPYIQFMNDSTAFAVGDSRLMIYTGSQKPASAGEYLFEDEIKSVFHNDRYIGLVFPADNTENRYRLEIYDTDILAKKDFLSNLGSKEENKNDARVVKYYFDMDYADIFFGENSFTIYNETECNIITMDGIEKYNGRFAENVELMIPMGNTYKYILISDDSIDTIQLK